MAKVPKYVPQQSIRFLLGRIHVGTPDAEIAAEITRRLPQATPRQLKACIGYAMRVHRENQGLYNYVMGGR
jgi:hypothetical protein